MESKKLHECLLALKDLKQYVKCPVCLEVIKDTVEFKCEHRLCRACFQLMSTEYQELKKCPLCKLSVDRRDPVYKDFGADAVGRFIHRLSQKIEDEFNIKVDQLNSIENIEKFLGKASKERIGEHNASNLKIDSPQASKKFSKSNKPPKTSKLSKKTDSVQEKENSLGSNKNIDVIKISKEPKNKSNKSSDHSPKVLTSSKKNPLNNKSCSNDDKESKEINAFDLLLASTSNRPRERKTYINRKHFKEIKKEPIELLRFQDNKNKQKVIEWLSDNKNIFHRLTQTQTEECEHGSSEPFNLPSVSQLRSASKPDKVTFETLLENFPKAIDGFRRTRARSLDIQLSKTTQINPKTRRHSFAGETTDEDNYCIDDFNTEEDNVIKKAEEIAIIDLMEDEYLNTIDDELLHEKSKTESTKNTIINKTKTKLNIESNEIPIKKVTPEKMKPKSKSNKENKSIDDTGWNRLKDIRRTIRKKEKVPKKLNITLESTQNASKHATQTSHSTKSVVKPKLNDTVHKERKSYDLNKVETYLAFNIKAIEEKTDLEKSPDTSLENLLGKQDSKDETPNIEENIDDKHLDSLNNKEENSIIIKTEPLNESSKENIEAEDIDIYEQATQKIIINKSPKPPILSNNSKYQSSNIEENIIPEEIEMENTAFPTTQKIIHVVQVSRKHESFKSMQSDILDIKENNQENQATQKVISGDQIEVSCSNNKAARDSEIAHKTISNDISQNAHDIRLSQPDIQGNQIFESILEIVPAGGNKIGSDVSENVSRNITANKLQKGHYILNSMEDTLKSYASEIEKRCDINEDQLSLPSRLDAVSKPVSIFLKLVPLLNKLDPFIHQLRDLFKEMQKDVPVNIADVNVLDEPLFEDKTVLDQSTNKIANVSKHSDISNYLTCSDISVQTVRIAFANKDVQTDILSPEGFLISANEVFKTQEIVETSVQTDSIICPKCEYNIAGNSNSQKEDKKAITTRSADTQKLTGRYTLTEFFDDFNFETQDLLKQAQKNAASGKNKSNSQKSCDDSNPPGISRTASNFEDGRNIKKHSQNDNSEKNYSGTNRIARKDGNENKNQSQKSNDGDDPSRIVSQKYDQNEPIVEPGSNGSSVLVCSVPNTIRSNKRKRLHFLASDSENEDDQPVKKQPSNKFIEDDLSFVFDSEKPSPIEKNLNQSDESDDGFNYEEYIAQALKKYDENGVRRSGNSENDKEDLGTSSKKTQHQEMIKACNKLIETVTKNMTPEQDKCNKSTKEETAASPVVIDEENKLCDELGEDIFLDEHNMSKIERDISEFEKNANVNSENTDIIPATEGIVAYDKIIIQYSNNNKPEKIPNKVQNSLSENLFSNSDSENKNNRTNDELVEKQTKDSINNYDEGNMFVDSDSDQDTEVFSDSYRNLNSKTKTKINVLQNIKIGTPDSEKRKKPTVESDDEKGNTSDADIVDTTPQKKRRHLDVKALVSQRSSLSFDAPLPPPPGFGDDEIAIDDEHHNDPNGSNMMNSSSILGALDALEKCTESNRKKLEASTPYSQHPQHLNTEGILSLSPIPSRNRSMNIIEMVKQSKFSPLSISVRPSSQKPPALPVPTPAKQQSILSYFGKSQEKKVDVETKVKPCIACTRLSKDQVIAISSLTNKKLASYSNAFGDNVTHMIVSVNERNCVKDHTMKYILAVASGIWVLSFRWIQECLVNNCIVPEEQFEVLDSSGIPGPKLARTTRLSNPLLKGYKIHAAPPFTSTTQQDVEKVVHLLGGKVVPVVKDIVEDDGLIGIIITEASHTQDLEIYEVWLETFRVVTVDIEWLSKSVGQYSLVSLRSFALCSDDSICDLGYPEALIGEPLSYPQNTC